MEGDRLTFLLRGSAGSNVTDDEDEDDEGVRAPQLSRPNPVFRMRPLIGTTRSPPDMEAPNALGAVFPPWLCGRQPESRCLRPLFIVLSGMQIAARRHSLLWQHLCSPGYSAFVASHCARSDTEPPMSPFRPEREYFFYSFFFFSKRARLSLAAVRNWAIT